MNNKKETIPDIIAEFNQELSLDRGHILNYSNRLSAAWRREKDAVRSRIYRFNQKPSVTNTVTETVTNTVTDGVTQQKEERITKENLPPTPPIREKNKKEENAHPSGVRAARAHAREDVPDLAEVEETFKTICRNRYCNPVRKWSIHDIAKRKKSHFKAQNADITGTSSVSMRFLVSHPSAISGGTDKFKSNERKTYEQDQIEKAVQGTSRRGIRNEETAHPRASTQGGEANQKPGKPSLR